MALSLSDKMWYTGLWHCLCQTKCGIQVYGTVSVRQSVIQVYSTVSVKQSVIHVYGTVPLSDKV